MSRVRWRPVSRPLVLSVPRRASYHSSAVTVFVSRGFRECWCAAGRLFVARHEPASTDFALARPVRGPTKVNAACAASRRRGVAGPQRVAARAAPTQHATSPAMVTSRRRVCTPSFLDRSAVDGFVSGLASVFTALASVVVSVCSVSRRLAWLVLAASQYRRFPSVTTVVSSSQPVPRRFVETCSLAAAVELRLLPSGSTVRLAQWISVRVVGS